MTLPLEKLSTTLSGNFNIFLWRGTEKVAVVERVWRCYMYDGFFSYFLAIGLEG